MNDKKIKLVDFTVVGDVDADELGNRLVQCINNMLPSSHGINIVKVHVGNTMTWNDFNKYIAGDLCKQLRKMGATNTVFVPIIKGQIEDIDIKHVEVYNAVDS